ncbi:MAG: DUF1330 domain-containing protein [Rhodospirillaceae bacterium]|jgi:uncharacterized protein (DUF1330 family)|nr:DUF1330 domain-containing protein [Rhodospirillaceae bacterium]MBT4589228.1 DUF1330 domain-containing protein [Rhodospirillaceae bacterium]MBT4941162.1 DUF1330 domain-containing protein [Rhodospirillaceae bacterium]MBT5940288.1 DUF1330 domain-containing protein [Rhodospirillaceae bacterium]MBT7268294.1 DUF1330 domain-containing protein [Rhodospirillaceae bacterium]
MPAYWVARSKINNPDNYSKYTALVGDILKEYGGKPLSRGGKFQMMEGPDYFERFVIVEFPSFEDAVACFESDAYQAAAGHRRDGSGEVETVIMDATDGMGAN